MDNLIAAREVLDSVILVDGHNDLPWALREHFEGDLDAVDLSGEVRALQTDLPRLSRGGVKAQFWSVFVPCSFGPDAAVKVVLEQIDLVRRMLCRYPRRWELARTADDVERIVGTGRIASMLGAEGGHVLASSLGVLRMLRALGVCYLTLTHNSNVEWADSATDEPRAGGLTEFGRNVVREMGRVGMVVDLSHTSADTMRAALHAARSPVMFSHSSARALCNHPRNVPDDVLRATAVNGGVCMVTFAPAFVSQAFADWQLGLIDEAGRRGLDRADVSQVRSILPEWLDRHPMPVSTVRQVADHVEHVRDVAGIEHVGLGGDFDGSPDLTEGMNDVSRYPVLFAQLLDRGWSTSECSALAGGNVLRVLRDVQSGAEADV